MVNILDLPSNGEEATRSDGNLPSVGSLLRSGRDNSSHDIARLKPIRQAVRFGSRAREAMLIHLAHLARLSPGRGNEERDDAFDVKRLWRACSDTRGIKPVRFRQSPGSAVPFRASASAYFDGKSKRLQATVQFPPYRVHGGGVLERGLCLGQDTFQAFGLVRKKVLDELRPLPVIARLAGDGKVAHPVRPAPLLAEDVLDFQWHVGRIAIGAPPSPLLQEVLPHLAPCQFPMLVLDALNFRVLHQLHVELDEFLGDTADRAVPHQATNPGEDIGNAALD